MVVLVRHGHTSFNENGKEKLRGWLNLPLNSDGMNEAIHTAKLLKRWKIPFTNFHSSPLKRATQTADEIANETGNDYQTKKELMDWNYGKLTGTPVEKSLDTIFKYIDHPDKVIPDGESFNDFLNRDVPYLKNLVEDNQNHLLVTHNRVLTLAHALAKNSGKNVDIPTMKKDGPVAPGGIMAIGPDWKYEILHAKNGHSGA